MSEQYKEFKEVVAGLQKEKSFEKIADKKIYLFFTNLLKNIKIFMPNRFGFLTFYVIS